MIVSFDIETAAKAPDDRQGDYALGITCIASAIKDADVRLWHGGEEPTWGEAKLAPRMSAEQCKDFAAYLVEMNRRGYHPFAVNGLGFDFQVLAAECRDELVWWDNLRELALASIDPAFQHLCEHGWMIGVEAMLNGIGQTKTEGMDGKKAVEMWQGSRADQDKVLEYVTQDAAGPLAVYEEAKARGFIAWVTKSGDKRKWYPVWMVDGQMLEPPEVTYKPWEAPPISYLDDLDYYLQRFHGGQDRRLLTCAEALTLPLPPTPTWLDDPWTREMFAGWAL